MNECQDKNFANKVQNLWRLSNVSSFFGELPESIDEFLQLTFFHRISITEYFKTFKNSLVLYLRIEIKQFLTLQKLYFIICVRQNPYEQQCHFHELFHLH